ncbi:MAG: hypothetical protein ACR2RL_14380 [Gammaproteobacteria bacterium]
MACGCAPADLPPGGVTEAVGAWSTEPGASLEPTAVEPLTELDAATTMPTALAGQTSSGTKWHPGHYALYWWARKGIPFRDVKKHDVLRGAQVVYKWKSLEPHKDQYDFSQIRSHLNTLQAGGKYLVAQIQMDEERSAPDYVKREGGTYQGRPKLWTPEVRDRVKKLVRKLAAEFDAEPYFEAVNFPETSIGKWSKWKHEPEWKRAGWIEGFAEVSKYARTQFRRTNVIQYVNWGIKLEWLVSELRAAGAGMGGPDNHPRKKIKSYPLFAPNASRMPLAIAVQPPEYKAVYGYTAKELFDHAVDKLRVNYVFWARTESHVSFKNHVLPTLIQEKGRVNVQCPENIRPCLE